jgi:3-dehydroquinate synthase
VNPSHLILTGFSGTGKSAVGRLVARRLGWPFLDTDAEVVRRAGKPIAAIFAQHGQPRFRDLERQVLQQALAGPPCVIATGGGALVDPSNRDLMLRSGVVVCLEARPETIHQRLQVQPADGGSPEARPLLADPDPLDRIRTLKAQRQALYALAHWTVATHHMTPGEVADEVLRGWQMVASRQEAHPDTIGADAPVMVATASGVYPILVGWGLLDELGARMRDTGLVGAAFLVTDETVAAHYGAQARRSLEAAGFATHVHAIPPGEPSKTLATAQALYAWLAGRRAERRDVIVALGGGVVGYLAGYVAATYLRGMPFVQVPTSLAAMVDASIGGKVAVDLPEGKNLVGAFHQPRLVLADVQTLTTLPPREVASGWAEAIKHGLILDADLFAFFESQADKLLRLEPEAATYVIRWSAAIKADVVSRDEQETRGLRTLLNYGHTIGHALETATEYGRFLHGEAVAVGMRGAALIGQRAGVTQGPGLLERQQTLLKRFGLPDSCPGVDLEAVERAMGLDKKTEGGRIQWVLLERLGRAVVRGDVPADLPFEVLRELVH